MTKRIILIHAVAVAMPPINEAFRRLWPAAECVNLLDDSLAVDRRKTAELTPGMFERFEALTAYAQRIGGDGLLFTCSAFGAAIDAAERRAAIPVLKPNEAMFEEALQRGRRIGMVATFPPSVASMEQELRELAALRKADATLKTICVPDAMDALNRGDTATHNTLVAEAARGLTDCDAVMLAHFSTSNAEAAVASQIPTPVLTSPGSAVRKLRALLTE